MSDKIQAIEIGQWALAYDPKNGNSLIRLDWQDVPPLALIWSEKEAVALANAILAQYKDRPTKR